MAYEAKDKGALGTATTRGGCTFWAASISGFTPRRVLSGDMESEYVCREGELWTLSRKMEE